MEHLPHPISEDIKKISFVMEFQGMFSPFISSLAGGDDLTGRGATGENKLCAHDIMSRNTNLYPLLDVTAVQLAISNYGELVRLDSCLSQLRLVTNCLSLAAPGSQFTGQRRMR